MDKPRGRTPLGIGIAGFKLNAIAIPKINEEDEDKLPSTRRSKNDKKPTKNQKEKKEPENSDSSDESS